MVDASGPMTPANPHDDNPPEGTSADETPTDTDQAEYTVSFRLVDDNPERLAGVRLWQEVRISPDQLAMTWAEGVWTVALPRPAVDRMEYLFELAYADGGHETICDPGNPLRVGGAFGDHSVHEFPQYRSPGWLDIDVLDGGRSSELHVPADSVAQGITGLLWTCAGLDDATPAGLIVVHDGPEYDQLAGLTRYLSALIQAGSLPPLRAALLAPGPRDEWYSASGAYGRALTRAVVPHLRSLVSVTQIVGMGASLGALEMLVAHRSDPQAFDGLFLQSGSYFTRGLDDQESSFSEFERIARSVEGVLASAGTKRPIPTMLTCGGIEENLGNNRAMLRALSAQGYPVELREVPDVHNYTAWRDAFDPYLTRLLNRVIGPTDGRDLAR